MDYENNYQLYNQVCSIVCDNHYGYSKNDAISSLSKYAVKNNINLSESSSNNKFDTIMLYLKNLDLAQLIDYFIELANSDNFKKQQDVIDLLNNIHVNHKDLIKDKSNYKKIIKNTTHWLEKYEKAYKEYKNGLELFNTNNYGRNIIDNMRLSYELLLKDLLNNNSSLEKQNNFLSNALREKNISKEIRDIFINLFERYYMYNNRNAKHDNTFNQYEVEFIIEQTSIMMQFLIKILGENKKEKNIFDL